jgi:hypothetical protein
MNATNRLNIPWKGAPNEAPSGSRRVGEDALASRHHLCEKKVYVLHSAKSIWTWLSGV